MEYRVHLPHRPEIVTYKLKGGISTVRDMIFAILKTFELDSYSVDDLKLVVTTSPFRPGSVLEHDSFIKDLAFSSTDTLGLFEKPALTIVIMEDPTQKRILLDHSVPLGTLLPVILPCFKTNKSTTEFGFILADTAEAVNSGIGTWINANHTLEDYKCTDSSVLGIYSLSWWKSVTKKVVDSKSIKSGLLVTQSSSKWFDRTLNQVPPDTPEGLGIGKQQKKYLVYSSPRLYIYKNITDSVPHEVVSVDLFMLKMKHDGNGHRIILQRAHKTEASSLMNMEGLKNLNIGSQLKNVQNKEQLKEAAQVVLGKVKNYYIFTIDPEESTTNSNTLVEWYDALKADCMNTGATRVFGIDLETVVQKQESTALIPEIISATIRYLDVHGLDREGIFRLNGDLSQIQYYRDLYDIGEFPSFDDMTDPYTVGALLKLYLRELPEPILTFELYPKFLEIIQSEEPRQIKVKKIIELTNQRLPDVNFLVVKCLLSLLRRVSQFSEVNKMTLSNLATVFGPNFLKPKELPSPDADAQAVMKDMLLINEVTEALIENESLILPRAAPKKDRSRSRAIFPLSTSSNSKPPPPRPTSPAIPHKLPQSAPASSNSAPNFPSIPTSSSSVPTNSPDKDKRPLPKPRPTTTHMNKPVPLGPKDKPRPQPPAKKPIPASPSNSNITATAATENISEEEEEPNSKPEQQNTSSHVKAYSTSSLKISNSAPQDEIASIRSEFNLRLNHVERQFTQRINTLEKDLIKERKLRRDLEEQLVALTEQINRILGKNLTE